MLYCTPNGHDCRTGSGSRPLGDVQNKIACCLTVNHCLSEWNRLIHTINIASHESVCTSNLFKFDNLTYLHLDPERGKQTNRQTVTLGSNGYLFELIWQFCKSLVSSRNCDESIVTDLCADLWCETLCRVSITAAKVIFKDIFNLFSYSQGNISCCCVVCIS